MLNKLNAFYVFVASSGQIGDTATQAVALDESSQAEPTTINQPRQYNFVSENGKYSIFLLWFNPDNFIHIQEATPNPNGSDSFKVTNSQNVMAQTSLTKTANSNPIQKKRSRKINFGM